MSIRKIPFVTGEYYHIFNRGTDKRIVFADRKDMERFLQSMQEFNQLEPVGSLYENYLRKKNGHPVSIELKESTRLVEIVCYCLNPNHFHFILKQVTEKGVEKFMQRLGNGYAKYFNHKNKRSGTLFQGRFKSVHIDSNDLLLYLSVYVNCNSEVHGIAKASEYPWCSYSEYLYKASEEVVCQKTAILEQFKNPKEYETFCREKLKGMKDRKEYDKYNLENSQ